ncbi:MAG: PEP-CTERM sorting domain-containing protein [Verrucomicrobiota bacterium]
MLLTSQARATVITALNFNELPSEQGWTLVKSGPHANDAEGDLFSVSGGQLFQNTVGTGQGFSSSGSARYDFTTPSSFADADVITFFFTTRVTAHEDTRQDFSWASHFFSIYHDGQRAFAGIKPGELFANGTFFTPAGYDGGLTNSYQLSLFTNTNTFEFYLNGVLVRSGASTATTVADRFSIMDGTGTANADAVLSQFVAVSGTVVPEPSSLFGVFLASCALLRIGLRRRRVAA